MLLTAVFFFKENVFYVLESKTETMFKILSFPSEE